VEPGVELFAASPDDDGFLRFVPVSALRSSRSSAADVNPDAPRTLPRPDAEITSASSADSTRPELLTRRSASDVNASRVSPRSADADKMRPELLQRRSGADANRGSTVDASRISPRASAQATSETGRPEPSPRRFAADVSRTSAARNSNAESRVSPRSSEADVARPDLLTRRSASDVNRVNSVDPARLATSPRGGDDSPLLLVRRSAADVNKGGAKSRTATPIQRTSSAEAMPDISAVPPLLISSGRLDKSASASLVMISSDRLADKSGRPATALRLGQPGDKHSNTASSSSWDKNASGELRAVPSLNASDGHIPSVTLSSARRKSPRASDREGSPPDSPRGNVASNGSKDRGADSPSPPVSPAPTSPVASPLSSPRALGLSGSRASMQIDVSSLGFTLGNSGYEVNECAWCLPNIAPRSL
jgi:hypothetical protein